MKNLAFVIGVIIMTLLLGCTIKNPQLKAKKVIREHFKLTLNDYKSYEPLVYGELVRVNSFIEVKDQLTNMVKTFDSLFAAGLTEENMRLMDYNIQKRDSIRNSNKNGPGWKMDHTFRARIPAGGYMLHHYVIYFDLDITEVKDIDEVE